MPFLKVIHWVFFTAGTSSGGAGSMLNYSKPHWTCLERLLDSPWGKWFLSTSNVAIFSFETWQLVECCRSVQVQRFLFSRTSTIVLFYVEPCKAQQGCKNTTQKKLFFFFFFFCFFKRQKKHNHLVLCQTRQCTQKKETQAGHSFLLGGL